MSLVGCPCPSARPGGRREGTPAPLAGVRGLRLWRRLVEGKGKYGVWLLNGQIPRLYGLVCRGANINVGHCFPASASHIEANRKVAVGRAVNGVNAALTGSRAWLLSGTIWRLGDSDSDLSKHCRVSMHRASIAARDQKCCRLLWISSRHPCAYLPACLAKRGMTSPGHVTLGSTRLKLFSSNPSEPQCDTTHTKLTAVH